MTIPLLDAEAAGFDSAFLDGVGAVGFVALRRHGIDGELFDRMHDLTVELFALDDHVKATYAIARDDYRGFVPLGFFTPNRAEVTGGSPDRYEGFKLHWECPSGHPVRDECRLYGSNRWLDELPTMRSTVLEYWTACDRLADRLLGLLAGLLDVPATWLRSWHDTPLTNMTLLHYPAVPPDEAAVGIHPHKDTNVLTILGPDPVGGLEVRLPDGTWTAPDLPPDAVLVNCGEMLELWSGGQLVATPHRVSNRSGADRYSYPWFLVPNHDVLVEPLIPPRPGYSRPPMPVGPLSAEVWRTNWPDEVPDDAGHDLGSLAG